jgi:exodeoxyribonuclease VII small subunit
MQRPNRTIFMEKKQDISFEKAMDELESLIKQFEEGQMTLDQAVYTYERGIFLKNQCFAHLEKARAKIEKLAVLEPQAHSEG